MQKITVLIADDHALVREGLRAILRGEPDIAIVGEAATGREAVELVNAADYQGSALDPRADSVLV